MKARLRDTFRIMMVLFVLFLFGGAIDSAKSATLASSEMQVMKGGASDSYCCAIPTKSATLASSEMQVMKGGASDICCGKATPTVQYLVLGSCYVELGVCHSTLTNMCLGTAQYIVYPGYCSNSTKESDVCSETTQPYTVIIKKMECPDDIYNCTCTTYNEGTMNVNSVYCAQGSVPCL